MNKPDNIDDDYKRFAKRVAEIARKEFGWSIKSATVGQYLSMFIGDGWLVRWHMVGELPGKREGLQQKYMTEHSQVVPIDVQVGMETKEEPQPEKPKSGCGGCKK